MNCTRRWPVFSNACKDLGLKIQPEIFPAGTDRFADFCFAMAVLIISFCHSAFLRHLGIPAFGFSPMNYTPILLHDHNERLNKSIFLKGISVFVHIIAKLSSAESHVRANL